MQEGMLFNFFKSSHINALVLLPNRECLQQAFHPKSGKRDDEDENDGNEDNKIRATAILLKAL